jgi:hypothetical protein
MGAEVGLLSASHRSRYSGFHRFGENARVWKHAERKGGRVRREEGRRGREEVREEEHNSY